MATTAEHVVSIDESFYVVGQALQRRTVVQYDFRGDETSAYCNDGTVWALRRGPGDVKEWQQQVHCTIPQPE